MNSISNSHNLLKKSASCDCIINDYESDDDIKEYIFIPNENINPPSLYNNHVFNHYWCDFCREKILIHESYLTWFVNKCIFQNNKYGNLKNASLLSAILSHNVKLREKFAITGSPFNQSMFHKYRNEDSFKYFIGGMIHDFNKKHMVNNRTLMLTNERCECCSYLACPFHRHFGAFGIVEVENKKIFCCGWCADMIEDINFRI